MPPKIYEVECDIHCPQCKKLIDKNTCACNACHYSFQSIFFCDERTIFSHISNCMEDNKFEEAAFFLQQLSRKCNNTNAMYKLAQLFLTGKGVSKSVRKAKICLDTAAKLNHIPSKNLLARLYCKGYHGFQIDKRKSLRLFDKLKTRNLEPASFNAFKELMSLFRPDIHYHFVEAHNNRGLYKMVLDEDLSQELCRLEYGNNWDSFGPNGSPQGKVYYDKKMGCYQLACFDYEYGCEKNDYNETENDELSIEEWEREQDDSMLSPSDREHYYNLYYNDDYDEDNC